MTNLPTGTVTFLFTDIEGSTQLWENHPDEMKTALAKHDAILHDAITAHHGHIIKTTGDGAHAVFEKAIDAIYATLSIQHEIAACHFFENPEVTLRVRIGLHTGEAELRADDYYGQALNRTARIMSVAHGGQILVSAITSEVVREHLPADTTLLDLGEHRLKDLVRPEHIFQINTPYLQAEFPPLHTLNTIPNNLPLQLTSFIGREKEIGDIKSLLNTARLVTLTGSGGTGKTRLSLEVAAKVLPSFANGVWLIELAPLGDAPQIIPTIAQVFGLQELPFNSLTNLVIDYLHHKKILLILDNCEHLIEACARLANDVLHRCAGLKILASSRDALGISGEVVYHTPSLANSESVQLFTERALAVNPSFHLTGSNSSSVAQICSRLDGIPLALELAAARVKSLSPEQIATRLDDMFRLLVGGSRTALPRQQTLRALIDWSYDLLSDEEKRLLQFASVFVGGWTLEALESVTDDPNTLELLEQLINKSLVVTEERSSEMRYFLLETIRQYAREKLFEAKQSSQARERHFFYFDDLSELMWLAFRSPTDQLAWRNKVDDELENLRSALEWSMENNIEGSIHLAANFCIVSGWISSIIEDLPLVQSVIERIKSLPPLDGDAHIHRQKLIARALFALGMVTMGSGIASMQALQEAIAISRLTGDRLILGYSLEMAFTASRFNDVPGAVGFVPEGLSIFTNEIDDNWGLCMAYQNMVSLAAQNGDLNQKEKYLGKLKELMGAAPTSFQSGIFFLGIGLDESVRGNYKAAEQIFENGLTIFRRLRNRAFQLILSSELGHIARHTGDLDHAREIYHDTIKGWQDLGNRAAVAHQLECFGFLSIANEEPEHTIELFGAAEALREASQSQMTDYERIDYELAVTQVRAIVTEAEFNTLWIQGQSLTMEEAIELALSEKDSL